MLVWVEFFALEIPFNNGSSCGLRNTPRPLPALPPPKENHRDETGDDLFLRRQQMRLQTDGNEHSHQNTENHNSLQEISHKKPCAFTSKAKCFEPIKAEQCSNDKNNPVGGGSASDMKRRLHSLYRWLPGRGLFPYISLPGRPILFLSALDSLKIFFSLLACSAAEKSADGEW